MDPQLMASLTEGDFGPTAQLGLALTEGDFWPRRKDCYALYRGVGSIDKLDYSRPAAVTENTGTLLLPDSLQHEPGQEYFYAVRRISTTGRQEKNTAGVVCFALDENGTWISTRPQPVRLLTVDVVEQGCFRLQWWFIPLAGQDQPVSAVAARQEPAFFAIYSDNGSGLIDYDSPLEQVTYNGPGSYSWQSEAFPGGTTAKFSVRTVNADGIHDGNTASVTASVDLAAPAGGLPCVSATAAL